MWVVLEHARGVWECARVTEGLLWPAVEHLTYHWDCLNKKEGLGGWAPGNFGD